MSLIFIAYMGTDLNFTKIKFHEDKNTRGNKMARRRVCTKGQFCTSYVFAREQKNTHKKKLKKNITNKKEKKNY